LRVVQMGLGPIGRGIALRVHRERGMDLVGAVDPDSNLAGRDLGEVLGEKPLGIPVVAGIDALPGSAAPDLVLHATGSFLEDVADQLVQLIDRGLSVVSTCEELAYPYYRHPELARRLDAAAGSAGVVLLGSGVNPGFVMDKFVVTLMAACESVRAVRVERVVDASTRRGPFQKKIGAGMDREAFEQASRGGRMGHIGLAESAHMLADAMGASRQRRLERDLRPVIAERPVSTDHVSVQPGQVAGVHEEIALQAGGAVCVRMELDMFVGAPNPHDAVIIEGTPRLEVEIGSGVAGDEGTVAVVVSCVPLVASLAPGLRTMLDVPLAPTTAPRGILTSTPTAE
jgi:hypothetical protein